MRNRPLLAVVLLFAAVAGCTPLGLWVYEDPRMVLRSATQIRAAGGEVPGDSLEFVLVGCNLNDYDLMGDSVHTTLSVDGRTIAEGTTTRPLLLATRDTSRFSVTVPLGASPAGAATAARPFELLVVSTLRTPLGARDLTYRLTGDVSLKSDQFAWRVPDNRSCKPGGSSLPEVFDRSIPLDRRSD